MLRRRKKTEYSRADASLVKDYSRRDDNEDDEDSGGGGNASGGRRGREIEKREEEGKKLRERTPRRSTNRQRRGPDRSKGGKTRAMTRWPNKDRKEFAGELLVFECCNCGSEVGYQEAGEEMRLGEEDQKLRSTDPRWGNRVMCIDCAAREYDREAQEEAREKEAARRPAALLRIPFCLCSAISSSLSSYLLYSCRVLFVVYSCFFSASFP
jgi:hypothetical protein